MLVATIDEPRIRGIFLLLKTAGGAGRRGIRCGLHRSNPRPTRLPGVVMGWLTTFGGSFTGVLPHEERANYLECVRERIQPHLCDGNGHWTADYVRIRFKAHLTE